MNTKVPWLIAVSMWPLASMAQQDHVAGGVQEHAEQTQAPAEARAGHGSMREHMQTMHEQMSRIHATEDPAERQRLMREHMRSMEAHMQMMARESESGGDAASAETRCADGEIQCPTCSR